MAFDPIPGKFYRQPVFFGPINGPRQWPHEALGDRYDPHVATRKSAAFKFLTDKQLLEDLLPPGFELRGEPVVTLDCTWVDNLQWMAGRGYAMSDVKFPAVYNSKEEGPVPGTLVVLRWENLTDPIITGREELGHHKLYCKIPRLVTYDGHHRLKLSWLDTQFADVDFWDMKDAPPPPADPDNTGQLGYKWTPRTGRPGEADAEYCTYTKYVAPAEEPRKLVRYQEGQGRFDYRAVSWQEFPFAYNVVSGVAALKIKEFRGASITESTGGAVRSGFNTRIVR